MNKQMIWKILGIEETKEESVIKQAYRKKLTLVNPEDNAQDFMKLRKAYEEALQFIKMEETGEDKDKETGKDKTEIEIWLEKADGIYWDIHKRIDVKLWEELLHNNVCIGLDTSLEAGEKLLAFLTDHYYLPQSVWQVLDQEFRFAEEKERLCEKFPEDFIDYVMNQVQTTNFLDYNLFEVKAGENVDSYIKKYYEIKGILDRNVSEEMSKLSELFEEIDTYQVYHPYTDVEKMRFFLKTSREHGADIAQKLIEKYPDDIYILYYFGKVKWNNNDYLEAYRIWNRILEVCPDHYSAKAGIVQYFLKTEEYEKARDMATDLLEIFRNDQEMMLCLREANQHLISLYTSLCLGENKRDPKLRIDLGWCFFQNERYEECERTLEEVPEEDRNTYDYMYLSGRNYIARKKYEKSLEYFLSCLAILKNVNEDSLEEEKKRLNRLGFICYCIAQCYKENGQYDTSLSYFKDAIEKEENYGDRFFYMDQLCALYLKMDKNEESIDVCDQIIKEDKNYYPAYLHRQEGYFNLKNLQCVMNDFYSCTDIFPGFVKPYVLAAKALYFAYRYEESKNIILMAWKAGLSSNELELCYIRDLRYLADTQENIDEAVQLAKALKERLNQEDNDIEDISEVDFEIARLYVDGGEEEKALEFLNYAVRQNPSNSRYQLLKAGIYLEKGEYQKALNYYMTLEKELSENADYHYNIGRCLEGVASTAKALKEYKKALEIDPQHRLANNYIMNIYQRLYKTTEKSKYYEEAVLYADRQLEILENCYSYVERGLLFLDGYELEKAIADFEKGAQLNKEDLFTHNNAGYSYKILRELDKGIEELKKAVSMAEPGQTILPYGNLASCYEISEQYEKAIECLDQAIVMFPENADMYERKGEIYTKMGQYKKAVEAYKKLYDFSGKDRCDVYIRIGDVYESAGCNVRAFLYYKRAIYKNSKSAEAFCAYGSFRRNLGHYRKAVSCFTQAVIYTDKNDYAKRCIDLAFVYWEREKLKKAEKWAGKALAQIIHIFESEEQYTGFPMNASSRCLTLGYVYLFKQDLKKAEEYFTKSFTVKPCRNCEYYYCYEGYFGLGLVYEKRNMPEKALECYKKVLDVNWNLKKCKRKMNALKKAFDKRSR